MFGDGKDRSDHVKKNVGLEFALKYPCLATVQYVLKRYKTTCDYGMVKTCCHG